MKIDNSSWIEKTPSNASKCKQCKKKIKKGEKRVAAIDESFFSHPIKGYYHPKCRIEMLKKIIEFEKKNIAKIRKNG